MYLLEEENYNGVAILEESLRQHPCLGEAQELEHVHHRYCMDFR